MAESKLNKLTRNPLHEQTYSELRAAIMSARFAPGERLTVRGVADMLGISPMPVRAAFMRLVAEKAVVQDANGSVYIPKMTRQHYKELIELRALLEGRAAEMAAPLITATELSALEVVARDLTAASKAADAERYIDLNQRFKFGIVAAARSAALEDLVSRLWLQVGPFMRYYASEVSAQHALDRHDDAVEALKRRDGPAARIAIESDILDGANFLFATDVID
ncbi:GntR family transcriptional regulator [Ensifer soli]|uniref:GntR family transcriptional regulator n=1 Tax=Ciceribacter sp. sgz301302 TaxID=3342379 RepID=UPI0035BA6F64